MSCPVPCTEPSNCDLIVVSQIIKLGNGNTSSNNPGNRLAALKAF